MTLLVIMKHFTVSPRFQCHFICVVPPYGDQDSTEAIGVKILVETEKGDRDTQDFTYLADPKKCQWNCFHHNSKDSGRAS